MIGTRRSAVVNLRCTEAERCVVEDAADAAGMTVSAYARARLLGHRVVSRADSVTIRELRRLGGLLKRVHTESCGAYSKDTAAALDDLQAAIRRVAQ